MKKIIITYEYKKYTELDNLEIAREIRKDCRIQSIVYKLNFKKLYRKCLEQFFKIKR